MRTYRYDVYGSRELDLADLEVLVPQQLGLAFSLHESTYWGLYSLWGSPVGERIRIVGNVVDEDGELLEEDFPEYRSFVYVDRNLRPDVIRERLLGIEGLRHLRTRTLER